MKAKVASLTGAALSLVAGLAAPSSVNAATLTNGTYNVSAYISNFTPLGYTNYCFPNVENNFGLVASFTIAYNGPGKAASATIPVPFVPPLAGSPVTGPFIVSLALPATPAGSATGWNGNYTETIQPNFGVSAASSFTATLVVVSPTSFVGTMTLDAFSSGGSITNIWNECNVTLQYSAVYVGPAS
jgi:hypothetical protein